MTIQELAQLALATLDKQRQFFRAKPFTPERALMLIESMELEKQLRGECKAILERSRETKEGLFP
jgi:hypothetical protein